MVANPKQHDVPGSGADIVYPESDGEPMSDNTKQFDWIVLLKSNIDAVVPDFVAGNILWYPVEGQPKIRIGPDVLVALGRPKGDRGSYLQWKEEDVTPALVIEVLSPGNSLREIVQKSHFYRRYGVREQIYVDPESETGWAAVLTEGGELDDVPTLDGWTSPTLGIRFAYEDGQLRVFRPDGTPFKSPAEHEAEAAAARAETAAAQEQAAAAQEQAAAAQEQAARFAARLRELGVDPDAV